MLYEELGMEISDFNFLIPHRSHNKSLLLHRSAIKSFNLRKTNARPKV